MAITNPIKKIREDLSLTQREAASIAGVTEQVILKTEQGLYPTIGPSVLRSFSHVSGLSVGLIEVAYEDWINQELRTVVLPDPDSPIADAYMVPVLFPSWRSVVCRLNDVPDSVNSLCKLLKLNPYILQKWETGKMKNVPLQLVERISYIKGEF